MVEYVAVKYIVYPIDKRNVTYIIVILQRGEQLPCLQARHPYLDDEILIITKSCRPIKS